MVEIIMEYVKPELVVLGFVLYFIGVALKNSEAVKNKYIPFILGGTGIVLALIWVLATSELSGWQSVLLAIFTGIVQGVLVAALSNYIDQLIKQAKKSE